MRLFIETLPPLKQRSHTRAVWQESVRLDDPAVLKRFNYGRAAQAYGFKKWYFAAGNTAEQLERAVTKWEKLIERSSCARAATGGVAVRQHIQS